MPASSGAPEISGVAGPACMLGQPHRRVGVCPGLSIVAQPTFKNLSYRFLRFRASDAAIAAKAAVQHQNPTLDDQPLLLGVRVGLSPRR